MVSYRKRFSEADIAEILEMTIPKPEDNNDMDDGDPPNEGTLIMDATCCPADVAYPQDINLLEETIDEIYETAGLTKPRTCRRQARKEYLELAKTRKRTAKQTKSAVRKQLGYIKRDIGTIVQLVKNGIRLTPKQQELMNLLTTVYEQQRIMFENGTHSIPIS